MRIKVNGVTYTSIKKNSLAWYSWLVIKAIGYLIFGIANAFMMWAFFSFIIIVFG